MSRHPKRVTHESLEHPVDGVGLVSTDTPRWPCADTSSTNAQRMPAVMAHPAFKANPWATIREHAANSLAEAEAVKDVSERKRAAVANQESDKVRLPKGMQGMEGVE